jgi:excisionase family DNA binding protein
MTDQIIPVDLLLLDVEQACRRLGMGRSKIYPFLLSGELRSITIGRRRKIPVQALEEFIQKLDLLQNGALQ